MRGMLVCRILTGVIQGIQVARGVSKIKYYLGWSLQGAIINTRGVWGIYYNFRTVEAEFNCWPTVGLGERLFGPQSNEGLFLTVIMGYNILAWNYSDRRRWV